MWQREACPHLSDENIRPRTAQLTLYWAKFQLAQLTLNLMQNFSWGTLDYPPCSPDLAPTNFHLALLERAVIRTQLHLRRRPTCYHVDDATGSTSYASTCSDLSQAVTSASTAKKSRIEKESVPVNLDCVLLKPCPDD
jgi:hypothetical protein